MTHQYALENISDERLARIALCYLMPSGNEMTGALLERYGAVQTLRFGLGEGLPGYDQATLRVWRRHFNHYDPTEMALGFDLSQEHSLRVLIPGDADWPSGLNDLDRQAPYALWVRGDNLGLLTRPLSERATLVGRRIASSRNLLAAERLATGLSDEGVTVVALSSRGLERLALASAVERDGGAIAIAPRGLDLQIEHDPILPFEQATGNGVLLSEAPPGRLTMSDTVLGQQRIVAALSAMTTAVEAISKSDALASAVIASRLRRSVGAVPGTDASSVTNLLIHTGIAQAVTDPADILHGLEAFTRKQTFVNAVSEPSKPSAQSATTARPEQFQRRSSPTEIGHGPARRQ